MATESRLFCTYNEAHNLGGFNYTNHGKPWSSEDEASLLTLFSQGASLKVLCDAIQRSPGGILPKLSKAGLIRQEASWDSNWYHIKPCPEVNPEIKEQEMNQNDVAPNIETVVMIDGQDASKLTDTQIFDKIARLEQKIDNLNKINSKPKKLQSLIASTKEDIEALVSYVDGRE